MLTETLAHKHTATVLVLNLSTLQLYLKTSCETPEEACLLANKLFLKEKEFPK